MRIGAHALAGMADAYQLQQFLDPCQRRLVADRLVSSHAVVDLSPDRNYRIEGRQRILEDHRDIAAAALVHGLLREADEVRAVKDNAPAADAGARR